jgi:hypothetical protein
MPLHAEDTRDVTLDQTDEKNDRMLFSPEDTSDDARLIPDDTNDAMLFHVELAIEEMEDQIEFQIEEIADSPDCTKDCTRWTPLVTTLEMFAHTFDAT